MTVLVVLAIVHIVVRILMTMRYAHLAPDVAQCGDALGPALD
jgi:hypothetical protein